LDQKKKNIILINHLKVQTLLDIPVTTSNLIPGYRNTAVKFCTLLEDGAESELTKKYKLKAFVKDHPSVKVWTTNELEEEFKYTEEVTFFGDAEPKKTEKAINLKKFDRSISWRPTEKISKDKLV